MPILQIIIILIVVGFVVWLANKYVPMEANIKKILNIAAVVGVIIWLLYVFGVWDYLSGIKV